MSEIDSVLNEQRSFEPPADFARRARCGSLAEYERLHAESVRDPEGFFGRVARELPWIQPFERVLDWSDAPYARWFVGGKLNASAVCLDQHLAARGDKLALIWEGEPGEQRRFTYSELHAEVCRFAGALEALGLRKGERVAIYMPMVPELVVALLACARLGLPHSVVFGGFSAQSLRERIVDGGCSAVITADGGWRRGKVLPLKPVVDEALEGLTGVRHSIVVKRCGNEVAWRAGRDRWYHELLSGARPRLEPEPMDSEDLLFLLYTSGSTGKPKGIMHTTAGYLLGAWLSTRYVFDLREEDVYWCTADVGWVTGHSYVVYGPLANGATVLMYEGAPDTPQRSRWWEIVARHRVSILYTAPTAIRTFMRWGDELPAAHDLSSLRLLGTVGEPINPEAWMWYRKHIGRERCPIVDTWWQTETGSILIAPLPGAVPTRPGAATRPFFGVDAIVLDAEGKEVPDGTGGLLAIRKPWPSMLRGIWGDRARYEQTYWSKFAGAYFPGDGARRDAQGNFWIMGRVDDVIKVSGHRLATMELESALVSDVRVAEAAVVGRPDDLTGEAICAFVTLKPGHAPTPALAEELRQHVAREIGSLARPAEVRFSEVLPKTRSGKIMRRLLRDIAAGRESAGDTSTLEDYSVLAKLRAEDD
jgi:acetyl-CoA synthetase